ncbi:MAG: DUF885 domain-containing protein [Gammaproteobacteria bacterium]|nr:DUF885 domain-containing protein [Gammaproteobacteria bacterium]
MNNKLMIATALLGCVGVTACDTGFQLAQQVKTQSMENKSADENVNLVNLLDQLFEESLTLNPISRVFVGDFSANDAFVDSLTDDYLKRRHDLNTRYLALANGIDRAKLSSARQISYDILLRDLNRSLQGETFPEHFMPFTQFTSLMSSMAQLGSGQSAQPFNNATNYFEFATRLEGYAAWFDSAKVRLALGVENKVVLPRVLALRILPQLKAQIVDNIKDSIFYQPLKSFPESVTVEQQQQIIKRYQDLISEKLIPAYQGLYDFINKEYLPHTRTTAGYFGLPNGLAWYQFKANGHTTTDMAVADIHQLGLKEVKRILSEMDLVRQQVKFKGDLKLFFTHLSTQPQYYFEQDQQLIDGYTALKSRIDKVLPQFFDVTPKTPYVVKPVEAYRQRSAAGASYAPGSPDGTRPGTFYINTYNLKAQPKWGMMTLSLHEAAPGHHFQLTIQQELDDLPKAQRFGGSTAFIEGWALYSEYLGLEMGLFNDPYQLFGKLADEMLRAMRLVVDTGLHAKGWSREQAIQYMLDNSTMAQSDVESEVERYMALPGQALSYKIGQLKIIELRQRAEQALGSDFNIKAFHNQILLDGSLPLTVLERKIDAWIKNGGH